MDSFSHLKLKKKCFRILQVYNQLRIKDGRGRKLDLTQANPVNFEFLIFLMMSPLMVSEQNSPASSRVLFDTPKSIRHKAKHFQETENCEKI